MTKTDDGYECAVGGVHEFTLPTDSEIHSEAIQVCIEYDSEDTDAVRILRNATIHLEVVDGKDVIEKLIGVVLTTSESDAKFLKANPHVYNDIMSAIGEACDSIESDRVAVR